MPDVKDTNELIPINEFFAWTKRALNSRAEGNTLGEYLESHPNFRDLMTKEQRFEFSRKWQGVWERLA